MYTCTEQYIRKKIYMSFTTRWIVSTHIQIGLSDFISRKGLC